MEFRMLDEVVEIEGKGLMLFAAAEDCAALYDGCTIRDSQGSLHVVDQIERDEALVTLYVSGGSANYFERLFRNVRIDATLFALVSEAEG